MSSQPPSQPPEGQSVPHPSEPGQRLAEQLQRLSEVVETITYRLLELEDRIADQEQCLKVLVEREPRGSAASVEAQGRLDVTEARLVRIESVLSVVSASAASDHLSVVGGSGAVEDIDGPFPEEPEQRFLDELEIGAEGAERQAEPPPGFLTA
ncbi:MAG: hypothetical protein AB1Z21_12425 [Synechococcaceae cyanobacterium]